jgi:hypothetical protein
MLYVFFLAFTLAIVAARTNTIASRGAVHQRMRITVAR